MTKNTQIHHNVDNPLVSVIIPSYNCVSYIAQSIRSVLEQSYKNVEIIVLDDGSTDNTRDIVKEFGDSVVYIFQENQGVSIARNNGVNHANGELIVFLDADDIFLPGKLTAQLAVFREYPQLDIVHSGVRLISENSEFISDMSWYKAFPLLNAETIFLYKPLQLGALMFRKDILFKVGGFKPGLAIAEDTELLFRLCLMDCKMKWLKEVTVGYRQHSKSVTRDNFLNTATQSYEVLVDFFFRRALPPSIREMANPAIFNHLNWCAANFYVHDQHHQMYRFLRLAARYTSLPLDELETAWLGMIGVVAGSAGENDDVGKLPDQEPWKEMMAEISLDK